MSTIKSPEEMAKAKYPHPDVPFNDSFVDREILRKGYAAGISYTREHEVKPLVDLIVACCCPNCDGRGWYAVPSMPHGDPEQVQCQFCQERSSLLSLYTNNEGK